MDGFELSLIKVNINSVVRACFLVAELLFKLADEKTDGYRGALSPN